ncbi:MAG: hypothetical protein HYX66_09800 [Ignavibacteria bacterium]|nr:hypothetical protein [Ignavibacteria bacterium]
MRGILLGLQMLAMVAVYGNAQDTTETVRDFADTSHGEPVYISSRQVENKEITTYSEPYTLFVGAQVGIVSGAVSTETAERRKANPDFWFLPTYGAVITAPISNGSRIRGRLDAGVWTTGTRNRPYEFYGGTSNYEGYFVERYTYFTIAPYVNLSGILVGVGFDFPLKGEMWNPKLDVDPHVVDRSTMKVAMDFRVGGSITAWETDLGILNVELLAYYMFSGVYVDGKYPYGVGATDGRGTVPTNQVELKNQTFKNMIPAGAQLGISYQFKLGL